MKILQVKKYHSEIAKVKYEKAIENWKKRKYGYPVKSMFYFMLTDNKGYPKEERKNGYVAFDDKTSIFGLNKEKLNKNCEVDYENKLKGVS